MSEFEYNGKLLQIYTSTKMGNVLGDKMNFKGCTVGPHWGSSGHLAISKEVLMQ